MCLMRVLSTCKSLSPNHALPGEKMVTDPKQQLTDLIEAYAVARSTGNNLLVQGAGASLIEFLESCNITPVISTNCELPQD